MALLSEHDAKKANELAAHKGHRLQIVRDDEGVSIDCVRCGEILVDIETTDDDV